ncbi:MAG: hypothetical protein ABIQ52_00765 [Vicinamibacterales bacterium]
MDTTLVTVTLLSMGMAAALSVIVWRMLRVERQRSDARVNALVALSGRAPENPAVRTPLPGRVQDFARPTAAAGARLGIEELPLQPAPVSTGTMFVEPESASPWGHRFAVMAGLALVLATAILVTLTVTGRSSQRPAARAATATAPQPGVSSAGLELLSLRDTREPGSLTITGLVQNPLGGGSLTRVTVTAYAFDDKGLFLASGRASIDVASLAPGDQSPFVVSIPATETVARYRIGFRGEDGRVIAHIDKRQQAPVAANW